MSGSGPSQPLFLEERSYRQRRIRDVARILPWLGILLFAIPLLWPTSGEAAATTSMATQFIFGIWFLLIVLSGLVSARIKGSDVEDEKL